MKHKYRTTQIGGDPNTNKIVCINVSIILHDEVNNQIWLVGAMEPSSKNIRLNIFNIKNEDNIKIFITNHITPGRYIVTDGFSSYDFLDGYESFWTHEKNIHERGN